jgi:hypothetical protein
MNKLQAATKDAAARTWREKKLYYRVGSYFKGCNNCGERIEVESDSGKPQVRYLSGYDVFRAYDPHAMGFTYYCWTCSAKDERCWQDAIDIGLPAIRGSKEVIAKVKAVFRKGLEKKNNVPTVPTRQAEIAALEQELAALMALLKGTK